MTDTRNQYRAVSFMTSYGEMWRVQRKIWWWPFWCYVDLAASIERARETSINDASKRGYSRKVVSFGRLP